MFSTFTLCSHSAEILAIFAPLVPGSECMLVPPPRTLPFSPALPVQPCHPSGLSLKVNSARAPFPSPGPDKGLPHQMFPRHSLLTAHSTLGRRHQYTQPCPGRSWCHRSESHAVVSLLSFASPGCIWHRVVVWSIEGWRAHGHHFQGVLTFVKAQSPGLFLEVLGCFLLRSVCPHPQVWLMTHTSQYTDCSGPGGFCPESLIFLRGDQVQIPWRIQDSLCACVYAYSLSHVQLFATPWTSALQAPLSMGILQARILEWLALPSSRGIFPTQGSSPGLPHCRRILYHLRHQGNPA